MKRLLAITLVLAGSLSAQVPLERIADDAKTIDRVAEVARRDLPRDVLKRIVLEDIDLLRGKRADGTYQYASFERLEARRDSSSVSVQPRGEDKLERIEVKGQLVYRLLLELPTRRMLVTKNRRVWIDRVEIEYIPIGGSNTKHETVKVGAWLDPGQSRPIDFPEIARSATVRIYARAAAEGGYGNLTLTMFEAKIFDNPDSPYADAVATARAMLKALDDGEVPSIRSLAGRMLADLRLPSAAARPAATTVEVTAPRPTPEPRVADQPQVELYVELQLIEDLLTGSESEKREGLDKLHQLVRKMRPR